MCYATGSIPCSDACDEAGYCLLSNTGDESDDQNHNAVLGDDHERRDHRATDDQRLPNDGSVRDCGSEPDRE